MSGPRMPNGAPRELRDFVACRSGEVELDLADLGWIPRPDEVPDFLEPSVRIGDGATSTSAEISVGYGDYIRVELPTSIVDGQLSIDAADVGFGIGPAITKWVDAFNATLAANDKELEGISVDGQKITITKRAVTAAADSPTAVPAAGTATTTSATDAPAAEPEQEATPRSGCLAWVMGVGAAIAAAIGIGVWATSGDDDNDAQDAVVITAEETTTSSSSTTSAPTTTSPPPPPTTIAQVGQADTNDAAVGSAVPACGQPDGLIAYGDLDLPDGGCGLDDDIFDSGLGCRAGIPCSALDDPYFVAFGTPGIDHSTQTPDALTGVPSNSTYEEWLLWVTGREQSPADVLISATCSGQVVTGAGTLQPGQPAEIAGPLYQYGECTNRSALLSVDERSFEFPQADGFTVGDPEPPAMPTTDVYTVQIEAVNDAPRVDAFFSDVNTVHNTIGGTPGVGDDCFWFFEPGNVEQVVRVLDGCSSQDHFWVFAAATTNVEVEFTITDTVIGTTATYADPLGGGWASVGDTEAFRTSGPLFDDSVFPCGNGHVAYTACSDGAPPMEAGGFLTVAAAMGDSIPLSGDGVPRAHHVDFGATGGGRYSIVQSDDGWGVSSAAGTTRARALIRGNAMMLVLPNDELPDGPASYQWSTEIDGAMVTQPVVPVVGVITTPTIEASAPLDDVSSDEDAEPSEPAEPPRATESLADFYAQLSASVAAGDAGFSLERLDPRVFEVYPDSCPAALASFADPDLVIEFLEEGPFEPWTYEADGRSIAIPDALTVTIRLTGRGQSGEPSESHLTIVDGQYRWFTFC